jgi:hypothetical protein
MLANILLAIAVFCQTNPSNTTAVYKEVKDANKQCHQKLVKCVTDGDQFDYAKKLSACIEKGDY